MRIQFVKEWMKYRIGEVTDDVAPGVADVLVHAADREAGAGRFAAVALPVAQPVALWRSRLLWPADRVPTRRRLASGFSGGGPDRPAGAAATGSNRR
jgi:hypothetical protein